MSAKCEHAVLIPLAPVKCVELDPNPKENTIKTQRFRNNNEYETLKIMAGRRGQDTHIAGIVSFIFWLLVKYKIFADSRVCSGDDDEDDDDRYHIRRD